VRAITSTLVPILSVAAAGVLAVACGETRDDGPMSEGRRLALDSGCAACHGSNGEGGVGPTWVGLYGSTVTLEDGSTVTADDAYLFEAIRDPSAKKVKGYSVMPPNSLSDAEVQAIVDYIKTLTK